MFQKEYICPPFSWSRYSLGAMGKKNAPGRKKMAKGGQALLIDQLLFHKKNIFQNLIYFFQRFY